MSGRRGVSVLGLTLLGWVLGCSGDDACEPPCREGFVCRGDVCEAATVVGRPCATDGECGPGFCDVSVPGGYCVQPCGGEVVRGEPRCPAGAVCTQLGGANPVCMASCAAAPCRDGYACQLSDAGDAVCLPACAGDADCGPGRGCDDATGRCTRALAPSGRVGDPCASDAACAGSCLTEAEGLPGGACTVDCERAACPAGSTCVRIDDPRGGEPVFVCNRDCEISAQCRPQYYCGTEAGRPPVCIPRCTSDDICPPSQRCERATGVCVPRGEPQAVAVDAVDLGSLELGGGRSAATTLEVPEDARGFQVVVAAEGTRALTAPFRLEGPGGEVIFDYARPQASFLRVHPSRGRAQLLYPNAPRLSLVPGRYRITFASNAPRPTRYAAHALVKRADAPVRSGRLDLNLIFAGVEGIDAERAPADADFQQMLTRFEAAYAEVGVRVGEVRYFDVRPDEAARFSNVTATGEDSELEALYALAERLAPAEGLNFLFIETLEGGQDGFVILGISGGIPGPVSSPGRIQRGVAVTAGEFRADPSFTASIMIHEAGHYLGLFHVSERDGTAHDPLLDTPECGPGRDRDGDGVLSPDECAGAGARLWMFWSAQRRADLRFSDEQAFVLHRNPGIR